jgi:hypothetical protein
MKDALSICLIEAILDYRMGQGNVSKTVVGCLYLQTKLDLPLFPVGHADSQ